LDWHVGVAQTDGRVVVHRQQLKRKTFEGIFHKLAVDTTLKDASEKQWQEEVGAIASLVPVLETLRTVFQFFSA
jgi:hypothetical protein